MLGKIEGRRKRGAPRSSRRGILSLRHRERIPGLPVASQEEAGGTDAEAETPILWPLDVKN